MFRFPHGAKELELYLTQSGLAALVATKGATTMTTSTRPTTLRRWTSRLVTPAQRPTRWSSHRPRLEGCRAVRRGEAKTL